MRVLTSQFVAHFPNRIVNIHHSFLPAFIGAEPYRQAFERGVKIIGATAHFVDENLDEGASRRRSAPFLYLVDLPVEGDRCYPSPTT